MSRANHRDSVQMFYSCHRTRSMHQSVCAAVAKQRKPQMTFVLLFCLLQFAFSTRVESMNESQTKQFTALYRRVVDITVT